MAHTLDTDFKTIVLKMWEKLKEDVDKVKKTKYEQNGDIS